MRAECEIIRRDEAVASQTSQVQDALRNKETTVTMNAGSENTGSMNTDSGITSVEITSNKSYAGKKG